MADMNIPVNDVLAEQAPAVAPPTRMDDQIFRQVNGCPLARVTAAFTTSFMILAIYIQQFWDTMCFNSSTRLYSCQLDEKWFNLHKYILKSMIPGSCVPTRLQLKVDLGLIRLNKNGMMIKSPNNYGKQN
nr:hypothetical protein [Tanacetum cinerariifolium]